MPHELGSKAGTRIEAPISTVDAEAFTIPTDAPESDGTIEWDSTTLVVCHVRAGDTVGMGYTYSHATAAAFVHDFLGSHVVGRDAMDVVGTSTAMAQAVRNLGRDGLAATAISAVDAALWDLKARLLDLSMVALLGAAREAITIYGSGGFTSYSDDQLRRQLSDWVGIGIPAVKMKIGRDAAADPARVHVARTAIGPGAQLFVDANGGYDRKVALEQARRFEDDDVSWFEEPVSSDDLEGLRLIRDRAPVRMEVAAGEYGYDIQYFRRMVQAGAVDVLQADATRCGGVTGFLRAATIADAWSLPLSAHTSPSLHAHLCCAVPRARNLEYFHDHVRIERLLFDGALTPIDGALRPDRSRPGFGIDLKRSDAERFAA